MMITAWVWALILLAIYVIFLIVYLILTNDNSDQASRWQIFGIVTAVYLGVVLLFMGIAFGTVKHKSHHLTNRQLENELVRRKIEEEQRKVTHDAIDRRTKQAMHDVATNLRCKEQIDLAREKVQHLEDDKRQFRDQNFYDQFIAANMRLNEIETQCASAIAQA